jgi:Na+-transporting NADH:ubiquinone oxidoreductase subunit NqrC
MFIGIIMGVSLIALASIYFYPTPKQETENKKDVAEQIVAVQHTEEIKTDTLTINREVFKFDNIEMKTIAKKVGDYYGKQIVFENEEAKHVRLYIQIEKTKRIEEVVEFMNNFKKVHLTIEGNSIHIR